MQKTIRNSTKESKGSNGRSLRVGAIRQARAEALHEDLRERGVLVLSDDTFRLYKWKGWSRQELIRAADDLAAKGIATVSRFGTVLEVRLLHEEDAG